MGRIILSVDQQRVHQRPSSGSTANFCRTYHRARVFPQGLSVVVAGDIKTDMAIDAVSRVFGDWQGETGVSHSLAPPPVASRRQIVVTPMMNKSQADIAYGFTTITREDPAYYAYWLMANILGQYGMGGRLGQSIRGAAGHGVLCVLWFRGGTHCGSADRACRRERRQR